MSADIHVPNHPASEQPQHHCSQAGQSAQVHAGICHHDHKCTCLTCLLKGLPLCPLGKVLPCRVAHEVSCSRQHAAHETGSIWQAEGSGSS